MNRPTNTPIPNLDVMKAILQKIKDYDRIMLFRHFRNDGDCVGSTKGLQAILHASFPQKEILLIDDEHSDFLAFLGPDDDPVDDSLYTTALGIVLDTATADRISNKKYALCPELIKIDHHLDVSSYGDLNWVESHRCSACELVVKFYDTFREELTMTPEAATYLYTGMVTDSGRFRFRSVSGDTMRYAGILLDQGINTDILYGHLYLQDFEFLRFKSYVYEHMEITENGVASIYLPKEVQERYGLTQESASTCVSFMDSIRGCLCWLAFIETGDEAGTIRVRLRSRFVAINHLAEQYRGGGHACACGSTVYTRDEVQSLLQSADALVKDYKESHEDWL